MKTHKVFINQYGQVYYAETLKELRTKIPGHLSKMYCDDKDGKSFHVGYVIGHEWFTMYKSVIKEV